MVLDMGVGNSRINVGCGVCPESAAPEEIRGCKENALGTRWSLGGLISGHIPVNRLGALPRKATSRKTE